MIRLQSKLIVYTSLLLLILCMFALEMPLLADPNEGFTRRELHNTGRPDHEGGEAGGLAALLFGIANFTVV